MKSSVVLDLDGPILDCTRRHYSCYRDILLAGGYPPLSEAEYWARKRNGESAIQLLGNAATGEFTPFFRAQWRRLVETEPYLALDALQPGAMEKLDEFLGAGARLAIVSLRSQPAPALRQARAFGLDVRCDRILFVRHAEGAVGKARAAADWLAAPAAGRRIWIGDSEIDAAAAAASECYFCAVTCGVRNESFLRRLTPHLLLSDLRSLSLERLC